MLITFEGLDYMGKSTLLQEVSKGISCLVTKEPGSPFLPVNQAIRQLVLHNTELQPMQRELLFYADALGHKDLVAGQHRTVLSDRGIWSHYAYLYGYLKTEKLGDNPDANYTRYGLCKKLIKEVCAEPDAVVYLEGSLKLMEERQRGEKDAIESNGREYYSYVLAAYDDLIVAREIEQKPMLILDAKSSIEANTMQVVQFITNLQIGQKCHTIGYEHTKI